MKYGYKEENLNQYLKQEPFVDKWEDNGNESIQFCIGKTKEEAIGVFQKLLNIRTGQVC